MTKGRKRLPDEVKKLAGTLRKDRVNKDQPHFETSELEPPPHLSEAARQHWYEIAPQMIARKVLTDVSRQTLAAYCVVLARWIEAERRVTELGLVTRDSTNKPGKNPFLTVAEQALKDLIKLASELGLTPASVSRVKAQNSGQKKTLAEVLAGKN